MLDMEAGEDRLESAGVSSDHLRRHDAALTADTARR